MHPVEILAVNRGRQVDRGTNIESQKVIGHFQAGVLFKIDEIVLAPVLDFADQQRVYGPHDTHCLRTHAPRGAPGGSSAETKIF